MQKFEQIDNFCKIIQVSRETISSLKKYEEYIIDYNTRINLVGKSTINNIWERHFLDSAQVIDFIDKNINKITDVGTGAGFPGIVLSILAKNKNLNVKIDLIEKSPKKSNFLKKVIKDLDLNVSVTNKNILDIENKINSDLIVSRAFKPLAEILKIFHEKAENYKKILLFLGKTGKNQLLQASKIWDIEYKQSISVTSGDSLILEIKNFKKK